jgi:hypothetical protein
MPRDPFWTTTARPFVAVGLFDSGGEALDRRMAIEQTLAHSDEEVWS